MLSREQILSAEDIVTETFDVPKWGEVTIRTMTGEQREELEGLIASFKQAGAKGGKKSARAIAAVFSLVDASGVRLFKVEDAAALAQKSGVALDCIFDRVLKLNAMTKSEAEAISGN